jgi:hypothetical protein
LRLGCLTLRANPSRSTGAAHPRCIEEDADPKTQEADGIIVRKDLSDLVLHIEYDLDDGGGLRSLGLLGAMGDFYLGTIGSEQKIVFSAGH